MKKFKELGLGDKTLKAVAEKGFEEPTKIQAQVIPHLMNDDRDLIGQAQTGTGKTAAFALPLIEKLDEQTKHVQTIVLAPTRELVIQICEEINSLKGKSPLFAYPIYGGQSLGLQLKQLKKGVPIVVGTPGRVLDHIRRKSLKLGKISYFILDEADEMLNMGFIEDIETIFDAAPKEKKVLLFSATMPKKIKALAGKYMRNGYVHITTKTQMTVSLTDQIYFEVAEKDKFEALSRIIDIEDDFYGLVFCRTKVGVDKLSSRLIDRGYDAEGMHGDMSQSQRERILQKFRSRGNSVLIATDVAARGIDVNDLSHVINYSIPQNPESYTHRIGRTGRAGKKGTAITFVTPAEFRKISFIKKITDADIRKENIPDVGTIISVRKQRVSDKILSDAKKGPGADYEKWAKQLLKEKDSEKILAAVLKHSYSDIIDTSSYSNMAGASGGKKKTRKKTEDIAEGTARLFIAKGKKSSMTRENLMNFISKKAGTPSHLIRQIEIHEKFSFITVPFKEAEKILNVFKASGNGTRSVVELAKSGSSSSRKTRKNKRKKSYKSLYNKRKQK